MHSINFLQIKISQLFISPSIEPSELMVRAIGHPIFYDRKKGKLGRNAFLPPANKNEVSVYRHRYATANTCKKQAKKLKIGSYNYIGLAVFNVQHLSNLNINHSPNVIGAVIATPLDRNLKVLSRRVHRWENGMPFHADLIYTTNFIVEEGQVNTPLRKYAEELTNLAKYVPDPNPEATVWLGARLDVI